MAYAPRPGPKDLDAKYEFLNALSLARADLQPSSPRTSDLDRARAEWVFKAVPASITQKNGRVLDYGGADGKLLALFLEAGCACFVIDYSNNQIGGIGRLGEKIGDLTADDRFDVIVASHVLEHVAHPREDLIKLREHLAENGVIYCEVPNEIVGGLLIDADPVTHINFFTPGAFDRLLEEAGLRKIDGGRRVASYDGRFRDTLWAVANRSMGQDVKRQSIIDIEQFLYPRRRSTMWLVVEVLLKTLQAYRVRVKT